MPYEVTDNLTKKTILFDNPPTDSDIQEAFGSLDTSKGVSTDQYGSSISQETPWKRTVSNIQRPISEALGMVLGGIAGSGATPLAGTVAGAGLGYAGGASVADLIDTYLLGIDRRKPLGQTLQRTAEDVMKGSTYEMGGQAVGRVIPAGQELLLKFLKSVKNPTPEMASRMALSEETGIPFTSASVKESKPLSLIEGYLSRNIASAGEAQQFKEGQKEAINKFQEKLLQKSGGGMDKFTAGSMVKESASANEEAWRGLADDAFQQVYKLVPKGTPIPTTNTERVAAEVATDLAQSRLARGDMYGVSQRLTEPARKWISGKEGEYSFLEPLLQQTGKEPGRFMDIAPATWQGLHMDRKWLSSQIEQAYRAGDKFKAMTYQKLKNAIDADIEAFSASQSPEFKEAFDWANTLYKSGADIFKDRRVAKTVLQNTSPEKIIDTFVKPNNASNMLVLRQALGSEGMVPVKQAWLESLMTKGEEQAFDLKKFATAFRKYDDRTLSTFLSENEIRGLRQLEKVSRIIETPEKLGGNPSGTAQQAGMIASVYSAFRHPVMTAISHIGANRVAKLYFENPAFRNTVMSGLKAPEGSQGAVSMATKLMSIASQWDNREQEAQQ